jgi:hypothetical protein
MLWKKQTFELTTLNTKSEILWREGVTKLNYRSSHFNLSTKSWCLLACTNDKLLAKVILFFLADILERINYTLTFFRLTNRKADWSMYPISDRLRQTYLYWFNIYYIGDKSVPMISTLNHKWQVIVKRLEKVHSCYTSKRIDVFFCPYCQFNYK